MRHLQQRGIFLNPLVLSDCIKIKASELPKWKTAITFYILQEDLQKSPKISVWMTSL